MKQANAFYGLHEPPTLALPVSGHQRLIIDQSVLTLFRRNKRLFT